MIRFVIYSTRAQSKLLSSCCRRHVGMVYQCKKGNLLCAVCSARWRGHIVSELIRAPRRWFSSHWHPVQRGEKEDIAVFFRFFFLFLQDNAYVVLVFYWSANIHSETYTVSNVGHRHKSKQGLCSERLWCIPYSVNIIFSYHDAIEIDQICKWAS